LELLLEQYVEIHGRPLTRPSGTNEEQSFGLQAEFERRGQDAFPCCRVILEDL
jgi:hypothetical protein